MKEKTQSSIPMATVSGLQIRGVLRIIQRYFFLFLNENMQFDPSLEPSQ